LCDDATAAVADDEDNDNEDDDDEDDSDIDDDDDDNDDADDDEEDTLLRGVFTFSVCLGPVLTPSCLLPTLASLQRRISVRIVPGQYRTVSVQCKNTASKM
jgi:hypothetical protein